MNRRTYGPGCEKAPTIWAKFRTACQDHQAGECAVKCPSQGHKRMARVGFEPRLCWSRAQRFNHCRDIPCQLTHFSAFFCRPSPILLKFDMFVGLDEKISHTKFQVSKSNSF